MKIAQFFGRVVATALIASGCGLDLGVPGAARIDRLPDPLQFGSRLHPALLAACGTAACHGARRTFWLHATDPLPSTASVTHPLELPEPLRSDYYAVLSFCNLSMPETSPLIRWDEPTHAQAMGDELQAELLAWLRGPAP